MAAPLNATVTKAKSFFGWLVAPRGMSFLAGWNAAFTLGIAANGNYWGATVTAIIGVVLLWFARK